MKYLIDTHILLWAATLDKKLPQSALDIIQNPDCDISYSVICTWELIIKEAKKKIKLSEDFFFEVSKYNFKCLDISDAHVKALRNIPYLHGDPFDRMLAAQALAENMTLITADKALAEYPVKMLFIGG